MPVVSSPCREVLRILESAYKCPEFDLACSEMRWNPVQGHVPRGFYGATGNPAEVELVMVFAEPGDPHCNERHDGLESAYRYAAFGYENGTDQFHRNVLRILNGCWPALSFAEKMRKVWLTDSVLCSARKEGGVVPSRAASACGSRYLKRQLELFPNALVVGFGSKAQTRLKRIGVQTYRSAFAVAPPGCNRRAASQSWEAIVTEVHQRRNDDEQS
jgi:hypothetical protein